MTTLRKGLPPLPARMMALPVDERGYPVPFFVQWIDGKPDFRVADSRKAFDARKNGKCWICGQPIYPKRGAFVIGPMCSVNRVSSEPPSHRECAEFSAKACPFLTRPGAVRREAGFTDETKTKMEMPAGVMLAHNPGVTLVWVSATWKPFKVDNGYLWNIGEPVSADWYCQGRTATRAEVDAAFDKGLPHLYEVASEGGEEEIVQLNKMYEIALKLLPAA